MGGMFGHDFAKYAEDIVPAASDYFKVVAKRMTERAKQEERIAHIMRQVDDKLRYGSKDYDGLNKFLLGSQYKFFGKYFEQPSWLEERVEVDPDFANAFSELSDDQKDLARQVFEEGDRQWNETQKAIEEAQPEGERMTRRKLEGLYVPMKRVGSHAVVARSDEYAHQEALAMNGDVEAEGWIEQHKTDDRHYYVSFHDGLWDALKERKAILDANPNFSESNVRASETEFRPDGLGEMQFQTYKRIEEMISNSDMEEGVRKSALKKVLQQLYIQSLNQAHAMKTNLRRHRIAGANPDALRVFAIQGRANAALVASLRTTTPLQKALQTARGQARDAQGKAVLNELLRRHAAMIQYRETPIQNAFMRLTGFHFLLTSPAYFLQNMTQPFLYSLPYVSGKHGYGKSWDAFTSAWGDTIGLTSLFKQDALDVDQVSKLAGNVGREVDMARELMDRNHLDVGLNTEVSDYADPSILDGKYLHGAKRALHALRGIATNVESVNRLSTALAAYRLEYAEQLNAGKSAEDAHTAAVEYADKVVIDTHGDYSGFNAPRYFMQGDSNLPIKMMTQFRKFQLIQISLLVKLAKRAYGKSSPQEKAIAHATLKYTLGQMAVVTGGLGLPIAAILTSIGLGGGDDNEARLRRLIGNKHLADLLLHGVPAALGLDLTAKLGMQNTFNPAAFVNSGQTTQDTLKNYAAAFVGGPSLSVALAYMTGLDQMFNKGHYWQGAEKMMPLGFASLSKGVRSQVEGTTNAQGDVVMKPSEISVLSAMFQSVGLPTTAITDRNWKTEAAYTAQDYFSGRTTEIPDASTKSSGHRVYSDNLRLKNSTISPSLSVRERFDSLPPTLRRWTCSSGLDGIHPWSLK